MSDAEFAQAVAAYRAGDFARAAEGFAELARSESDAGRQAVLHANAGTAAARAERTGEAVFHLESALRCSPRDAAARENLERLRARMGEGGSEAAHFSETLARIPLQLTPAETDTALGAQLGLALLLFAAWRARWLGRFASWTGAALLLLALLLWGWSGMARAEDTRRAVVLPNALAVRAEPQADAPILFRLRGGTVVSREEERRDWTLIESAQGGRGWTPAEETGLFSSSSLSRTR